MAHEITSTDGLVLNQVPAWHGLGTVVASAPTPTEALELAGLNWTVESSPLYALTEDGQRVVVEKHRANIRQNPDGSKSVLGVVGENWKAFQNSELAAFAEALAENDDRVHVESAGSIRGGKKVWFLVRGESFSVRADDVMVPYMCLSNGFDGMTAVRMTPTSVRVVCSNTLHAVIPDGIGSANKETAGFTTSHTGNLMSRLDEAKRALRLYSHAIESSREAMDKLAADEWTSERIQRFLLESYELDFGKIPESPTQGSGRLKAMSAIGSMLERFEREEQIAGATAWNAFNAYSGWLQNDRSIRVADADAREDRRVGLNLFGKNAERTSAAFQRAIRFGA